MVCEKCGTELKEGIKFCTKCGNKFISQNGNFNGLAISSVILMLIGALLPIGMIILGFYYYYGLRHLPFSVGVILAFFSLYKGKNKITLIGGIVALSLMVLFSFIFRYGY